MKIIISPAKKLNTDNPLINKKMEFNFLKEHYARRIED